MMPMPVPTSKTPETGFVYADTELPTRALNPGALGPVLTVWQAVDGGGTRFLAAYSYNGVHTHVIRPTRAMAEAAALQFYMHFTAQGKADSHEV